MATLLLILGAYFAMQLIPTGPSFPSMSSPRVRALAGKDSISGLKVEQTASGAWKAEFNYFYTGAPPDAQLIVETTPAAGSQFLGSPLFDTFPRIPQRGSHHLSIEIRYPGAQGRTVRVTALMRSRLHSSGVVLSRELDQVIDWPDVQTWSIDQLVAARSPEENLKQIQALIDTDGDSQLAFAKQMLEKLLQQHPNFDPAYIELARYAMRTNWGPEGLHQAEDFLATALQIRPDSPDAKILLGYVYAQQRRFAKAEALYKEAATTHTRNLWLLTNWGLMFELENQPNQAIAKYREVIAHPMTHDRNDRARAFAYKQLLALLRDRKEYDGMETLYKQQIAEFGWGSCYSADYTRFLLQTRGDVDAAIDSARRALNQNCNDSPSRELLGLAEYAKWADSKGSPRTEALNQARIFLPIGARTLYLLATSERTAAAARQLIAAGERVDQKDNENLDALAYALQNRDYDAARRLVALGARTETPVGEAALPVALLPVLSGDVAGVRLMRSIGVHYSKLRYRGATALDFAKQQGNEALLSALGGGDTAL